MNRALVLSGGANKGAFHCGVLNFLINDLKNNYNILCGTSVGALNCSYLGMFDDKTKAIKDLIDIWLNLKQEDVIKRHFPFGRLHGLWLSSFYNSNPIKSKINSLIDIEKIKQTKNTVCVDAVCMENGQLYSINQTNENFKKYVLASCSFPGLFKPVEIDNKLFLDGGVKSITPLTNAIELGADVIDVIICSPEKSAQTMPNANSIVILKRTIDLMVDSIIDSDIKKALLYNKILEHENIPGKRKVEINIIRPEIQLNYDSFNFDKKMIKYMIDYGYWLAKSLYCKL